MRWESPLADQTTSKPADLIYEDTGALAPLIYFDIVGAYGTMNGAVEVELATRILVPRPDGTTEVKFISKRPDPLQPERRHQFAQRPRCRTEDAGAAAGQYSGLGGRVEAELRAGSACRYLLSNKSGVFSGGYSKSSSRMT